MLRSRSAALLVAVVPVWAAGQSELPRWVAEVRAFAYSPKGDIGDTSDHGELIVAAVGFRVSPAANVSGGRI